MKNDKVLITLGCSFTEGVGCYDYTNYTDEQLRDIKKSGGYNNKLYSDNLDNFLQGSWGSQLQEMVGASTFYNFGLGGSSNSHQAKSFYNQIDSINLKDKDVLVVWLLTYSHRISFYDAGIPKTLSFNGHEVDSKEMPKLYEGLLELGGANSDWNSFCETYFYLQTISELCKNKNFKFAYAFVEASEIIPFISNWISGDLKNSILKSELYDYDFIEEVLGDDIDVSLKSKVCGHPNKEGYKFVAERMFYTLLAKYPSYCKNKLVELYNEENIEYKKIPMNREGFKLKHRNE